MDFASLNVGGKAHVPTADTVHEFTPMDGETAYLNGADEPLILKVADPSSPRARREMVKLKIKWPHPSPDGEWTEDELNRAADNEAGRKREMLARFVVGWNLQDGKGKAVEFTVDHAAQFFEVFPDVAEATMVCVAGLMDASGNVASGSVGGPRKKAGSRTSSKAPAKAGEKS